MQELDRKTTCFLYIYYLQVLTGQSITRELLLKNHSPVRTAYRIDAVPPPQLYPPPAVFHCQSKSPLHRLSGVPEDVDITTSEPTAGFGYSVEATESATIVV